MYRSMPEGERIGRDLRMVVVLDDEERFISMRTRLLVLVDDPATVPPSLDGLDNIVPRPQFFNALSYPSSLVFLLLLRS